MLAQVSLMPAESKKLISKAIARMDMVKQAADKGTLVLHPSSSTYFIVEELTGSRPKTDVWVCGAVTPKGTCGDMGVMVGEKSISSAKGPGSFPHSWVIRHGRFSVGETLSELLEQMGPNDVYVKGVNALDPQGNVGILIGNHVEGGTIGLVIATSKRRAFNLIFPVGLEKLIPVPVAQASKEARQFGYDYAMGVPTALLPCSDGKVVTEVDAVEILSGATAIPIAAGGLGGAEGTITMAIKGNEEQVKKAIDYAEQSKGARLPQLRLFDCHGCPNPMCKFPVGDKHWAIL
jgi:hypothetical protein